MHEQIIERALQLAFADQQSSLADALEEAARQVAAENGIDLDEMDDVEACEFGEVTEDIRTFADAGLLTDNRGAVALWDRRTCYTRAGSAVRSLGRVR